MKNRKQALKFFAFTFKLYPKYYFIVILNSIINAFLVVFNAYSLSLLIKGLESNIKKEALIYVGVIVLVNLIFYFLIRLMKRLVNFETVKMDNIINQEICNILTRTDFEKIEDPYYLELKERVKAAIEQQGSIHNFISSLASLLQNILTLIGLLSIILTFDYIVVLVIGLSFLLFILLNLLNLKVQVKFFNDLVPINRRYNYYVDVLINPKNGKDYRFYNISNLITKKFYAYSEELEAYLMSLGKKASIIAGLQTIVKNLENFFVYSYLIIKAIINRIPVSSFSLYVSSAVTFSSTLQQLVGISSNLIQYSIFVSPITELLELPTSTTNEGLHLDADINTIEFKNVSFKYPKSENLILDNVSFKINKGEKISIVGLNGAGKTTIVKLLCRLYKVSSGVILINDIDINEYSFNSYISKLKAVFQDYKLFAYTLKENILNADGLDEEALKLAYQVGLKEKIDSLPKGINSLYTKYFAEDGIELSGGEAQKIAIARALNGDSSLVILDEPTSALDPLAEAEIYENFNELVADKTAIYISHRMSSSVFCDKILLLNQGKVEAFKPHSELIKDESSLYYQLFMAQAKNYSG